MVQTDFNTDDDDCDGWILDGHACGMAAYNSQTEMRTGGSRLKCFNDDLSDRYHSNCSFPTGTIPNDATITAVALHIYFVGRVKPKRFNWNVASDARMQITTAKNQIGAELDTSDYDYGTVRYNSAAFKNWVTAEWKEFDLGTSSVYKDGDTDVEIRPNDDWWQDCDDQGKDYYLRWYTNEKTFPAYKPYLRVTYTVKGKSYVQLIGAS